MSESTALDPDAIERLRKLGGDKFAAQMIELFISYVGQKVADTRTALQAGNFPGVALAAHPVKSSAGNVGAVRVQELATQVEQSAKKAQAEVLPAQVEELERAFAEATELLQTEKAKLKP